MPTIHIIDSIKIMIYFDDHLPPHFHAEYNEYEELIEIRTLDTYRGKLPNKQRKKVIEWAKEHQEALMILWNEFNPDS
ncbi:MAG: DUF4160 domain-containing protein [Bacteroidota bacterium]